MVVVVLLSNTAEQAVRVLLAHATRKIVAVNVSRQTGPAEDPRSTPVWGARMAIVVHNMVTVEEAKHIVPKMKDAKAHLGPAIAINLAARNLDQ